MRCTLIPYSTGFGGPPLATLLALLLLWTLGAIEPARAATLRWGARGDAQTLDPHAFAELMTGNLTAMLYDALVERDREQRIVPALAARWSRPEPTRWRFELRRGVKFQDGSPFTADDAVFSIERAQQPTSSYAVFAGPLGKPVKIDDNTIELRQEQPNPLLLQQLSAIMMVSRDWALRNGLERVPSPAARQEAYSALRAMGTGRFTLQSRQPDVQTVLARNPNWWGEFDGNVDRVELRIIANDATRSAALLSGDIDFTSDVAPQDLVPLSSDSRVRVVQGVENRLIFFSFDLTRDELLYASVKGRNPFKDRRVREAFYLATQAQLLARTVMRGQAWPTDCFTVAAVACMAPELENRQPPDIARARQLMLEAGYPEGFELTLDCPNDRYLNDGDLCVAMVGMLARINVKLRAATRTKTLHFPKVQARDTSFFMQSWGGATTDAQIILDNFVHSRDPARRRGSENLAGVADPRLDEWIDAAAIEIDEARRNDLFARIQRELFARKFYLVLHRQGLLWAAATKVKPVILPSNQVRLDWIRVD